MAPPHTMTLEAANQQRVVIERLELFEQFVQLCREVVEHSRDIETTHEGANA